MYIHLVFSFFSFLVVIETLVRSLVTTPTFQFKEKDELHKGDRYCKVPNRSLIELDGVDTPKFLQGLITNDMLKIIPGGDGFYAAFLTPPVSFLKTCIHFFFFY